VTPPHEKSPEDVLSDRTFDTLRRTAVGGPYHCFRPTVYVVVCLWNRFMYPERYK
jgi:hypothetical protein